MFDSYFRPSLIVGALPVTLINGTVADATQVMSDLNWIVNQVNANAAPLGNTALLNANNNFTTVQSGVNATSAANFPLAGQVQNQSFNTLGSIAGTNTVTGKVLAFPLTAYATGQVFRWIPSQLNTGAATLNIDGVGAVPMLNMGSALTGTELRPLVPAMGYYDAVAASIDLMGATPFVQGPNIPSAATINLNAQFGDYNQIDGTTAISAMTLSRGRLKWLEFNSSPVLTSGASLIIGGANITPIPGDVGVFRGEASGVVRMMGWLRAAGAQQPTRTTFFSGSGTYSPPAGCIRLYVRLCGGGGGGAGASANNGTAGNNTTFGPIPFQGNGGGAGVPAVSGNGGAGGGASSGDLNLSGGSGQNGTVSSVANNAPAGGNGGANYFGGNGGGGAGGNAGTAGVTNTGAGGGGGGGNSTTSSGGGGGAGGYLEKTLFAPLLTAYAYSVGAAANGGAAGTNAGGNGGSGVIIIDEYYN